MVLYCKQAWHCNRHSQALRLFAGNNVGDDVLVTPAFKGRVPTGLLIAANMMVGTYTATPSVSHYSFNLTASQTHPPTQTLPLHAALLG